MFQIGRLNIVKSECIKIPRDLLKKKKRERETETEREEKGKPQTKLSFFSYI